MSTEPSPAAESIVAHMMSRDAFSRWLGIEVLTVKPGSCALRMQVRAEMTNGFHIAHGGIAYSLADSALAFASNGHGRMAVSSHTSISHLEPVRAGDTLLAEAKEIHLGGKLGHYEIRITNQDGLLTAIFGGSVYRTSKHWNLEE